MIVVDVETTGLRPEKNSIVSIGAIDFSNPQNQFYQECRIWEGAEISDQALKVNGFTKEEITNPDKPSLEETVFKFIEWTKNIEDQTLAGHNVWFDALFLRDALNRAKVKGYSLEERFGSRNVDLHSECYAHHLKKGINPPKKNERTDLNLDKVLLYVGLLEEPNPHNALTGAKMEAEAFSRFFFGKALFEEFEKYSIPNYLK